MSFATILQSSGPGWKAQIPDSKELERILKIPRREWTEEKASELAKKLTELLKTPQGNQELRPTQAVALHDLAVFNGLVCLGRVGMGKTLVSLLAPYVVSSLRPLLLIPANLRTKTERDKKLYRKHWEIAANVDIQHYEMLSRASHNHYLSITKPDLIICDEAHHLKNTKAAVVRRLKRYLQENPETKLCLLSGTLTNRSLKDYWHLLKWTLGKDNVPVPFDFEELELWSRALDEKVKPEQRVKPGALVKLCSSEELEVAKKDPVSACRKAYRRRLVETPGVVATKETFLGASLSIDAIPLEMPKPVYDAFYRLRTEWELPDGQPISDGISAARHAQEIALGFFYRWNPRPPEEWLIARRAWCKVVRNILANNKRNLDTEAEVVSAFVEGIYTRPEIVKVFHDWFKIKPTFEPKTQAVWIDDFALREAARWMQKHPGIVWVQHQAFGRKLSKLTKIPYYGEGGFDENKNFIENHSPAVPMIASIKANREGKNLQNWNTNLVVHPPSSGKEWEQMLGRTHRDGQLEDEVHFQMFMSCIEHVLSFWRASNDAIYVQDSVGQIQKLLYADVSVPTISEAQAKGGVVWTPSRVKVEELSNK